MVKKKKRNATDNLFGSTENEYDKSKSLTL